MKKIWIPLLFLFSINLGFSQEENLINSLKKEMNRFINELHNEQYPPYFIGYEVSDIQSGRVDVSFGSIEYSGTATRRILDIDLRVGNYKLDNTHRVKDRGFSFTSADSKVLPIEDDELAIRSAVWNATELAYKNAVNKFQNVIASKAVSVQEEDTSADFSREKPSVYFEPKKVFTVDIKKWENILSQVSNIFTENKWLLGAKISFFFENVYKIIVNTEGTEVAFNEPRFRIFITVRTKAEDGMVLYLYKTFFAFDEEGLPSKEEIEKATELLISKLDKLRNAPLMETYSGPAILSGEATGVFFHEIFGHRVEGHRQKDPNSSQTFKSFQNKKVLPDFISVVFDPTKKELNGKDLSGFYKFDDEGVPAQKVVSVDSGIFQNFIMSRSPIENFPNSNGHGRKQAGYKAVARQSNLIVKTYKPIPVAELKKQLIEECKKQGKDYGLFFETVEGGFTFTGRTIPNAFNVMPIIVYKVFADGRPDEIVRGVDLIGTPLTTFSNIIASGDDIGIFNGICGAESGGVPVSASAPSILVSKIEVQKKQKSEEKPPILSAP
jgi:predicted Zn-dependent protease